MRGAKGVGMGELLAKRPSILIMSICSLYHIFYVGISDIACNEFTKRSTNARGPPRGGGPRRCPRGPPGGSFCGDFFPPKLHLGYSVFGGGMNINPSLNYKKGTGLFWGKKRRNSLYIERGGFWKRNKKGAIKHGFEGARELIVAWHGLRVCASALPLGGQCHFPSLRVLHS